MQYILSYTKQGNGLYNYISDYTIYEKPYNCDWEHAMHLAYSTDGEKYIPLRNNTGILFAKCSYDEGNPMGVTKTLQYPYIFRMADGNFGVASVRRNQNAPDSVNIGCMLLFTSGDLVHYEEKCFFKLSDSEIKNPRCRYEAEKEAYFVEWESEKGSFCGYTKDFKDIRDVSMAEESEKSECDIKEKYFIKPEYSHIPENKENTAYDNKYIAWDGKNTVCDEKNTASMDGIIPGNIIEVTEEELRVIRQYFDIICNTGTEQTVMEMEAGKAPLYEKLPKVKFVYSDGSSHEKLVKWDRAAFEKIDFTKEGKYQITGEVCQKHWEFPMSLGYKESEENKSGDMSDPCVTFYNGKYYLTSSGGNPIYMRVGKTVEEAFAAIPIEIPIEWDEDDRLGTWAAELHIIEGVPYIMTALNSPKEQFVRAYVLKCNGNPEHPGDWEQPRLCVKPDGNILTEGGISLDMTYFCEDGVHYVMWSDRKVPSNNLDFSNAEPADIYIAAVNPKEPWKCITEPKCILRPTYGWERFSTNVVEGPYLLRHNDDLFITVSGSSTGVSDLYNLGFLHSRSGRNLLEKESWEWIQYPFLTKESVKNQFGPGHNNFVKDPENGDDLMVYHAVPHDKNGKALGRKPGIRRVHWASTGLPYLEMTEDRDVRPEYKKVTLDFIVK